MALIQCLSGFQNTEPLPWSLGPVSGAQPGDEQGTLYEQMLFASTEDCSRGDGIGADLQEIFLNAA